MTATAASLSADETPTANLVKAGDHYELELGIPQGRKGDTGATPKIKLSVVTGERERMRGWSRAAQRKTRWWNLRFRAAIRAVLGT